MPLTAARPLALAPGVRVTLDLGHESLQVLAIDRRLVSLRLERASAAPGPTREIDLAGGAVLHQAAGDIRTSRIEAMLAVLGRMGRADAAPVMAAIAREPGDTSLRWQALRECLALDTRAGLVALAAIAGDASDPLAAPASALHAELIAAHPELAAPSFDSCPA